MNSLQPVPGKGTGVRTVSRAHPWALRLAQALLAAWLLFAFLAQNDLGLADNGDYTRFMASFTSGPIGMENWPPAGLQQGMMG